VAPAAPREEVKQQVTVPLEIVMNGIPHLESLRSTSLLDSPALTMVFDDESENDWESRQSGGASFSSHSSAGRAAANGTDWSPVGQIYFYTLHSTNPKYDVMDLKSLEDWFIGKTVQVRAQRGRRVQPRVASPANIRCASIQ